MTAARRTRLQAPRATVAFLALIAPSSVRAACDSVAGDHVFATAGSTCAATGTYTPATNANNNAGLFAGSGGIVSGSTAVGVVGNGASGSYSVWSDGAGSQVNLTGPVTITTTASN